MPKGLFVYRDKSNSHLLQRGAEKHEDQAQNLIVRSGGILEQMPKQGCLLGQV